MKKFLAIPLLFVYLLAVSGTMVQFHYCGSKLASWNLNTAKSVCCCADKAPAPSTASVFSYSGNCCFDQFITLKIEQDQDRSVLINPSFIDLTAVIVPVQYQLPGWATAVTEKTIIAYYAQAPPGLWQNIPLYKLHGRFVYYG